MRRLVALLIVSTCALGASEAPGADRAVRAEVIVDAPIEQVWAAWTTEEGVKAFFAPACRIDLRVDGAYEMYFRPEAPPGQRGGEGLRLLQVDPPRRLAFTWNAPPEQPRVRGQRTMVTLDFESLEGGRTRVRLAHVGWGHGAEWDESFRYFDHAWKEVVMRRLVERFAAPPAEGRTRLVL